MNIYILNKQYEKIGFIEHADSILWTKKYNDVGECEVYLPCETQMLEIFEIGNYIYREDDDMVCEIKSIEIETDVENGNYLIVTGVDVVNLLSGRIITLETTFSGLVFDFIHKLIEDNVVFASDPNSPRAIPNFHFFVGNKSLFTETITVKAHTEDLLELIKTTCNTYGYGFKVIYNHDENITDGEDSTHLQFYLYKGVDRASISSDDYVEFSPEFSNIISSNYIEDDTNSKNVCYVGYKGEDELLHLREVYVGTEPPQGKNRKEIYVDGSSVSREVSEEELHELFPVGLTQTAGGEVWSIYNGDGSLTAVALVDSDGKITLVDYAYYLLLDTLGLNTLSERNRTQKFTGEVDTIDTYEYKTDYDVGDIVKVINEYGLNAEARITEVMESDDNDDGYQIEPKFEYIN